MGRVDWDELDLTALAQQLRRGRKEIEAERMIVAFEHCVELAKADEAFLDDVLVAVVLPARALARQDAARRARRVLQARHAGRRWQVDIAPLLAGREAA